MTHGAPTRRKNANGEEEDLPPPPDGGWGWVVVFGSFMVHVITDGLTYSFGIFYNEFLSYFNEGRGYTAWIASLLVGITLCSGPVSSAFVNKFGCRVVTIAGAILAGVCIICSSFAQNVATLIVTIGIGTGFGLGLIYLPAIVSVTMYFEKYRSLATGIAVCGAGFGTFIFAPLTETLIANYSWQRAMLIIAGIVFTCVLFGALFRPLEPVPKTEDNLSSEMVPINSNNNNQAAARQVSIEMANGKMDAITRSQSYAHGMTKHGHAGLTVKNENAPQKSLQTTLSQPFLHDGHGDNHLIHSHKQRSMSRTFSRPDIFYQGSLHNIPNYRSHSDLAAPMDKYGSIRHVNETEEVENKCCPGEAGVICDMLNLHLFSDPIFVIFTVSNFCTSIGFNVPFVYLASQAEELGISKDKASYLLSIIGIANTIGRIVLGFLADKSWVNRLYVYNVCLTACGLATILSIFCTTFTSLAIFSAVFGFTIGAYVGLTSVILVDLLGLDHLTNAFGLLLLFQGIASLVGPPAAGTLFDKFGSYNPGFILAGVMITASGAMLFAIPCMQKYIRNKTIAEVNATVVA
ncbi:Monocarboxylate transporter 5 [Pseudolycoriella hygida]|uniref:Monocarboxylate transporter 5 n=1 Tax=Pseudolycoriella hygida TaxID=35572 RepID=A0A9Q0MTA2_9DIPT|nr:Monocarboxylate transporter 5 [Pseudolycoriella hygida]